MNYCENCCLLCEESRCPACGSAKLRAPAADDYCFLDEKRVMWATMLRAALKDEGIDSAYRPVQGAALAFKLGSQSEFHRIYVPYAQYESAREVLHTMFAPEGDAIEE